MAKTINIKTSSGVQAIPCYAKKTANDGQGNNIPDTYATKTEAQDEIAAAFGIEDYTGSYNIVTNQIIPIEGKRATQDIVVNVPTYNYPDYTGDYNIYANGDISTAGHIATDDIFVRVGLVRKYDPYDIQQTAEQEYDEWFDAYFDEWGNPLIDEEDIPPQPSYNYGGEDSSGLAMDAHYIYDKETGSLVCKYAGTDAVFVHVLTSYETGAITLNFGTVYNITVPENSAFVTFVPEWVTCTASASGNIAGFKFWETANGYAAELVSTQPISLTNAKALFIAPASQISGILNPYPGPRSAGRAIMGGLMNVDKNGRIMVNGEVVPIHAEKADTDENGNDIPDTYATKAEVDAWIAAALDIEEYTGDYTITENGTIPIGGKKATADIVVDIPGADPPDEYKGDYLITENGTLPTKDLLLTDNLIIRVGPKPFYTSDYDDNPGIDTLIDGELAEQEYNDWQAKYSGYPADEIPPQPAYIFMSEYAENTGFIRGAHYIWDDQFKVLKCVYAPKDAVLVDIDASDEEVFLVIGNNYHIIVPQGEKFRTFAPYKDLHIQILSYTGAMLVKADWTPESLEYGLNFYGPHITGDLIHFDGSFVGFAIFFASEFKIQELKDNLGWPH